MPMNAAKLLLLNVLGGGAAFSPLDISGLALWLDASDSATLFQNSDGTTPAVANTDPVGYWADKSGNLRHATQSTDAARPILKTAVKNSRNVIRFGEAATTYLNVTIGSTLAQPVTYWLVTQDVAASNPYGRWVIDSPAGARQYIFLSPSVNATNINAGTTLSGTNDGGVWSVLTCTFNGASSDIRANGASVGTGAAGANGVASYFIGSRNNMDPGYRMYGYFGEIIVATGTQLAATVSSVEVYLADKWGITLP